MTVKKKKGFFDETEELIAEEKNVCGSSESVMPAIEKDIATVNVTDVTDRGKKSERADDGGEKMLENISVGEKSAEAENVIGGSTGNEKKGKVGTVIFLSLVVVAFCSFVFVLLAYLNGWFDGDKYSEPTDGEAEAKPKEEFYYYPADFETDIFTVPEYLELDRRIKYSPDSSQSYLIQNGNYAAEGEPGLTVIGEYLNAVIAGDHEKVNSLYTDKYVEDNGKHEKFPPQKLFNIKICNERVIEEKNGYTVYYFTVSYKIFKNDGLFRKNVDETRERAQIFEIHVFDDETGKINLIKDRPQYDLSWM